MTKTTKSVCQCCKGNGAYWTKLRQARSTPLRFAENHGCLVEHYVPCDAPGCHNGIVDHAEHYRILSGF